MAEASGTEYKSEEERRAAEEFAKKRAEERGDLPESGQEPRESEPAETIPLKQLVVEAAPLKEDNPLLEVRKEHADDIAELVKGHDISIVGISARSGSSSVMRMLGSRVEGEMTILNSSHPDVGRDVGAQFGKMEPGEAHVLVLEESGRLLRERERSRVPNKLEEILNAYKESRDKGVDLKLAFAVHDFYGESGEGGTIALEKEIRERLGESVEAEIGSDQLENVDKEGLGEILDIIVDRGEMSDDLRERLKEYRQQILDVAVTPQDVSLIVKTMEKYGGVAKSLKGEELSPEETEKRLEDAKKAFIDVAISGKRGGFGRPWREYQSMISLAGGEKMVDLMAKASSEESGVALADLSEEEINLYDRYRKFHFFQEREGRITVGGEALEDFVEDYKRGRL
jgi:hypothetical protein